jgi:hypothetical protein
MIHRGRLKQAAEWKWSSFRHYALREMGSSKSIPRGPRWIGKQRQTAVPHDVFLNR